METVKAPKGIIHTPVGVFAVTEALYDSSYDTYMDAMSKADWERDATIVMGKKVVPYGVNNNLPDVMRDLIDDNHLVSSLIQREAGLLYGAGAFLYKIVYKDGQITREYLEDKTIQAWLDQWDHKRYIDMAMIEFKHMKGVFAKRYLNRGARINRSPQIKSIEVVPGTDARLAWPETGPKRLESVRFIYTGDFTNDCFQTGIYTYPVYSPSDPFRHRVSIGYHNKYSLGMQFYPKPAFYGGRKWIARSNDIADVLKYLGENGISSAHHIQAPAGYWEEKKELLKKQYPLATEASINKKVDELQDELLAKMAKTLTSKKNTGKFLSTVTFYDENNNLCEWKVSAIDQKFKDYVETQLKISDQADSAITSTVGVHPSLSNIIVDGKLASGSEILYAYKLYMASDTTIPEEVIFEPINQAIRANFPDKSNIFMGFYHPEVMKESQVSPSNRVKESQPTT